MIGFGMQSPVLNEPRHPWYQKRNHIRIPKISESKKYLDAQFLGSVGIVGPSAPALWEIDPGTDYGEVDIYILSLGDGGDSDEAGDDLGVITAHRWRVYPEAWAVIPDSASPGTYTVMTAPQHHGRLRSIELQAIGYEGRLGTVVASNVIIPGISYSAPVNTILPALYGSTNIGAVLSLNSGEWSGEPPPTLLNEYLVNSIVAGTGATFDTTGLTIGDVVQGRVTATNSEGVTQALSSTLTLVSAAETFFLLQTVAGDNILQSVAGDDILIQETS